jgi:hypothetical protein
MTIIGRCDGVGTTPLVQIPGCNSGLCVVLASPSARGCHSGRRVVRGELAALRVKVASGLICKNAL